MQESTSLGQRPRLLLQGHATGLRLSPFEVIVLLAVLVAAGYGGYTAYARATDLNAPLPPSPLYLPASRTTLTSSVSATGTVQSSQQVTLTFGSTGKIKEFLAGLGAQVTAGQPLARLDDTDLQQALRSAESSLASAQARLDAVFEGPSETEIASSEQSVASARTQLATAEQNLVDLRAKPTAAEAASARQAVITAENALQAAKDAIPKAQNDVASAQNSVRTAQNAVNSAQNNLVTAQNSVTTAQNNLANARSDLAAAQDDLGSKHGALDYARSNLVGAISLCNGSPAVTAPPLPPVGSAADTVLPLPFNFVCAATAPASAQATLSSQIGAYNGAAGTYNSAGAAVTTKRNAVTTAENGVRTAENGVSSAQAALTKAQGDVANAQRSVVAAQTALSSGNLQRGIDNAELGLASAKQKQTEVMAGAKKSELDAVQRSIDSARASLATAEARYADLFKPAAADVVLPLQASVDQASANLETAKKNLAAATIVAPFDGQISQVTGEVGSQVSAATAVFILLNPRLIRIDANVDQADVSNLRPGQTATVTFDALSGRTYQAAISAIGLTPTIQQGVVTYAVTLAVDTSRLAEGTPIPTPGMTASITVTTSRTDNALVVPSRSIRRSGRTSTITVRTANGDEQRQVTTGATNGTLTQITSGVTDGELVLYSTPVTSTSAARQTTNQPGQQQFIIPGGGGPGGGTFIR